jgi:uncharacterized SAM-binding protein YcdF (DUF218 family)
MKMIDDITDFIFMESDMKPADIIFIPGGSCPELGEYAAALYKKNLAPAVMPSGGVSIKTGVFNGAKSKKEIYSLDYPTDCAFLTDVLKKNGVPEAAIYQENESGYTKENAFFSRRLADGNRLSIQRAILVCKCFHARRAFMCYQLAFPETEFMIHPVPYLDGDIFITKENWFKTDAGIDRVLGEMMRCANQFNEDIKFRKMC